MKPPHATTPTRCWTLPPLILHPFTGPSGPEKILESSRASLILNGMIPNEHGSEERLRRILLDGRFSEICMLFYVGKDLSRWIDQCLEFLGRFPELKALDLKPQSFSAMLVENPPAEVKEKLKNWGVVSYQSLFSRALGLRAMFAEAPFRDTLSEEFLLNYYRYADHLYACHQSLTPYPQIEEGMFHFELYASREYSRLLEREWSED